MERRRDARSGEVISPAPLTKGCGFHSIIAPQAKREGLDVAYGAHINRRGLGGGAFRLGEGGSKLR